MSAKPETLALSDLLRRVKEATGPDPRLDQMIFAAVWGWSFPLHGAAWTEFQSLHDRGRLTGSIEAALNAVHRELPGSMWATGCMEGGPFCRLLYPAGPQDGPANGWGHAVSMEQEGGPPTEPLAILHCLLSAMLTLNGGAQS